MNIRKVLTTKVVPALLIAALVLNFSVSRSFAWTQGGEIDISTFISYNTYAQIYNYYNTFVENSYEDYYTNYTCCVYGRDTNSNVWRYITAMCTAPFIVTQGVGISCFFFPVGSYVRFVTSNSYANSSSHSLPDSKGYTAFATGSGDITVGGITYAPINPDQITYSVNYSTLSHSSTVVYTNFDMSYFGSTLTPNLTGTPSIQLKVLEAALTERYGSAYISVTVSDNVSDDWDGSYSFVTVSGVSTGINFSYTFGFNSYLEKQGDPPYAYFLLDPSQIPWDVFTLTSLEYVSSGSFGSKTISVDFKFGESPIEYDPITNNYFWSNTSYTEYNGGSAWGFDYIKVDTVDGDFWDDNKVLIQPFSFSVMAFPVMPSGITSMDYYVELVNDYLSYYDVILTEVPESTFDNLYGAGAFDDFQSSVSWAHYGNFLMDVSEWYSAHSMIASPLDYEYYNDLPIYSSNQSCGIAFSDHFYFKQLSYMLGDTSDILTEFSSRFYEEDGFTDVLTKSLSSIYDGQYEYFNGALTYLERQNYFINDLILNKYIPDSVDLLKDIKQLLGDILNALGENAPIDINDLESPLLDIYQFIDALYQGSKTKISDLRLTLKAVSSGILPDGNGGEVYLLPTGSPTPVPLPTVPVLPALP